MMDDGAAPPQEPLQRLRYLMARLRNPASGCPWDLRQTHASVAPYAIEEATEVVDAIERGDDAHLREELGDLLFQVILHTQLAEERNAFAWPDVLATLEAKLVRRHPHVFPDGSLGSRVTPGSAPSEAEIKANWQRIKAEEKAEQAAQQDRVVPWLDAVSRGKTPLQRANALQQRAAEIGFDWDNAAAVMDKIHEEIAELDAEVERNDVTALADELGDLMFCCVNLARHYQLEPDALMRQANDKFERRFNAVERDLRARGADLAESTLEDMEAAWIRVKQYEGSADE